MADNAHFPDRPGHGTDAVSIRPVQCYTNSFALSKLPPTAFHHYDVIVARKPRELKEDGSPVSMPKRMAHAIINKLSTQDRPDLFPKLGAYDGAKNLYTTFALNIPSGAKFVVNMSRDGRPRELTTYDVTLSKVNEIIVPNMMALISGQNSRDPAVRPRMHENMAQAISLINAHLRQSSLTKYKTIGRSFFTPKGKLLVDGGLEIWRGFFQSVRPTAGNILGVNVDITATLMYKPGPLIDLALAFLRSRNVRDLEPESLLQHDSFTKLQKFMKNLNVSIRTAKGFKTRKIESLSKLSANRYVFPTPQGETTVNHHYFSHHRLQLQHPHLICIVTKNKEAFPIELCGLPEGQPFKRTTPPEATRAMLKFTSQKPDQRLQTIKDALREFMDYDSSPFVRGSGLEISPKPLQVQGRVLQRPSLFFGQNENVSIPDNAAYNLPGKKFYSPAQLMVWAIVVFKNLADRTVQATVHEFQNQLGRVLFGLGMGERTLCMVASIYSAAPGQPLLESVSPQDNIPTVLHNLANKMFNQSGRPPQLVICILPFPATDQRAAIKFWGDVQDGIPTQCVRYDKIDRGVKDDYLHNLALKINARLGGINAVLPVAEIPWKTTPVMIIGADVSHPAPGDRAGPSIAGVCATIDGPLSKNVATSRVQAGRQEVIQDLQEMIVELLKLFRGFRQNELQRLKNPPPKMDQLIWPQRIIYYRDGVGEGAYASVTKLELEAIRNAVKQAQAEFKSQEQENPPSPMITFVIVSKKHHQRFFPANAAQADRTGNCPAGSVFDRGIAHPTLFDFYLQSQAAILGTARPAHYIVTHDEQKLTTDQLQKFTYNLAYTYVRATRAVSIPAPVYYADLICARGKLMFDPTFGYSDSGSVASGEDRTLDEFKAAFKRVHPRIGKFMFFV